MGNLVQGLVLCLALAAPMVLTAQAQRYPPSQDEDGPSLLNEAEQLFELANQARAQAGVRGVNWDPALSESALEHCELMAQEGPIAHQYAGEPDLATRAGQAGAHFNLIEENVAIGPTPEAIHDAWMRSEGHRANLLNADVDRIGVAVVEARGVLYAAEDFSRAVPVLSRSQVEIVVSRLVSASGVAIVADPTPARAACATDEGMPRSAGGQEPQFAMRWQSGDLTRLPQALVERLASERYRQAAVGSCAPQGAEGSFTVYRVAVLLY
jgi:uncharacterized protein YkwD